LNKGDLVAKLAKDAGITKRQAEKALNSFHDTVKAALKKGAKVTIVGFGTFSVAKRKARTGRKSSDRRSHQNRRPQGAQILARQ